jgi:hypothetical protein
MTAPNMFEETETYSNYEDFEFAVRDHRGGPPPRIHVPGGVNQATLTDNRGNKANLSLPAPVPTLLQYRTLEQAVSSTNARLSAATADLARMRQELAAQRQGGQGGMMSMMVPLIMQQRLQVDLDGHTHSIGSGATQTGTPTMPTTTGSGSNFSTLLPLIMVMMQPGMFGGSGAGGGSSFSTLLPFIMVMMPGMFGGSSVGSSASGRQDGMLQMMMMLVMMDALKRGG